MYFGIFNSQITLHLNNLEFRQLSSIWDLGVVCSRRSTFTEQATSQVSNTIGLICLPIVTSI